LLPSAGRAAIDLIDIFWPPGPQQQTRCSGGGTMGRTDRRALDSFVDSAPHYSIDKLLRYWQRETASLLLSLLSALTAGKSGHAQVYDPPKRPFSRADGVSFLLGIS